MGPARQGGSAARGMHLVGARGPAGAGPGRGRGRPGGADRGAARGPRGRRNRRSDHPSRPGSATGRPGAAMRPRGPETSDPNPSCARPSRRSSATARRGARGPVMPRRAPSDSAAGTVMPCHAPSGPVRPRQEIVVLQDSPTIAQNPQRARIPRRDDHPRPARGEGPSPPARGAQGGLFEAQLDPVRPCGRASSHGLPHTRRTRAHLGARGLFEVRRSPEGLAKPRIRQLLAPAPVPRAALRGAARRGSRGSPAGQPEAGPKRAIAPLLGAALFLLVTLGA